MKTTIKIRLNMVDAFSQAKHRVEKEVSREELKTFEHIQMTGGIIRQHENGITYYWQIEEVEVLDPIMVTKKEKS